MPNLHVKPKSENKSTLAKRNKRRFFFKFMVIEKRVKVHHHIHYFYIDENKILIFLFLMICFRLNFNVLKQNREFAKWGTI